MRVMGVDPGLRVTGYACVEHERRGSAERLALVEAGVFRLPPARSVADRLVELESDLRDALERLTPDAAAVEALFAHPERPGSVIAMGHARGVILLCLRRAGLPVLEFRPTRVKKSLTGSGRAPKAQVAARVRDELRLAEAPSPPDVADAIAVALCAARSPELARALGPGPGSSTLRTQ